MDEVLLQVQQLHDLGVFGRAEDDKTRNLWKNSTIRYRWDRVA
jgi:hypothetical protein